MRLSAESSCPTHASNAGAEGRCAYARDGSPHRLQGLLLQTRDLSQGNRLFQLVE